MNKTFCQPDPGTKGAARISATFYRRPAPEVAVDLIGACLLVGGVGGIIVETEAYDHTDPASHCFRGRTARNGAMFGAPGSVYIYRSYGLHWCLNAVCGTQPGSAVLIRALHPTIGIDVMRQRRQLSDLRLLCSGPGRLCQALAITGALDGRHLDSPPFAVEQRAEPVEILSGHRVGITRGMQTPWRFGLRGSAFLSRPFGR